MIKRQVSAKFTEPMSKKRKLDAVTFALADVNAIFQDLHPQ